MNRTAAPVALFFATAIFARLLTPQEFTQFLIRFSAAQWAVAAIYQWQKNCVVRFWHVERYNGIAKAILTLSTVGLLAFAAVSHLLGLNLLAPTAAIYASLVGLLYFFGATSRMSGRVNTYTITDTVSQPVRWVVAVCVTLLFADADLLFIGLAVTLIPAVVVLALATEKPKAEAKESLKAFPFIITAGSMALFDFSAAAFMYADRLYIRDADYIVYSTVGAQAASIILGAYVSVVFPRVSAAAAKGDNWVELYSTCLRQLPMLALLTLGGVIVVAPIAIPLISPGTPINLSMVGGQAAGQILHFVSAIMGLALIIMKRNWLTTAIYGGAALVFFFLASQDFSRSAMALLLTKVLVMLVAAFAIGCVTLAALKGARYTYATEPS